MKYTSNLKLKKPDGTDVVNVDDLNDNANKVDLELASKVDKINGKGLSTNDYTDTEKQKLEGIQVGANKYTHPSTHPARMIKTSDGKNVEEKLGEVFQSGLDGKNKLETSIKSKGGRVSKQDEVATFDELDNGVKSIIIDPTGDATASSSNILKGKTAYVKGKKLTGSMPNRGNRTFTPSRSRQTSSSGYYSGITVNPIPDSYYGVGDRIPYNKLRRDVKTIWSFTGHTNSVYAVAVDNDGYVYSGSTDNTVRKMLQGFKIIGG